MKIETIPIKKLKPAAYNPRKKLKPTDPEYQEIKKSIEEFGLVDPIIWNKATGHIVGGHQRFEVLKEMGEKTIPVSIVNIKELKKEKALNVALNKIQGDWDMDLLSPLLDELKDSGELSLTGFDEDELGDLLPEIQKEGLTDDDQVPAKPKKPKTKNGNHYALGKHRLLCGDATNPTHVNKLLGESNPQLMVTDPPYGVGYDPEWREGYDLGVGKRSKGKVKNDDRIDWSEAFGLFPGQIAYVWHASLHVRQVIESLEKLEFKLISHIQWVKQHFPISRGDYHWQHESCLYMVKEGKKHNWQGKRDQSTVWTIQNNNAFGGGGEEKYGLSTQKPTECMLRPILNNSKKGEIVYDPFLGTGTFIIACEKSNRIGYGLEIDPVYCDVIVQRFENFTGKKAIKI